MRTAALLCLSMCVLAGWAGTSASKDISHINLLLPALKNQASDHAIEHTLEAFNGCYHWTSSQPDILRPFEVPDSPGSHCASKLLLKVAPGRTFSNTIWITAKDRGK